MAQMQHSDTEALMPVIADAAPGGRRGRALRRLALAGAGACAVAAATGGLGGGSAALVPRGQWSEHGSIGLWFWQSSGGNDPTPDDTKSADWWFNKGKVGGTKIGYKDYTPVECYVQALKLNGKFAQAWLALGDNNGATLLPGGGTGAEKAFTKKDCYIEAVNSDPTMYLAWLALATECKDPGVCGKAAGNDVTQKDCYINALKYGKDDPKLAPVWQWCGENNGANKCTEKSVLDCFKQAVTLDRKLDAAWKLLGTELAKQPAGSDTFISPWKGHVFDKNQCLEQAVLLKPGSASNWFQYCKYDAGELLLEKFDKIRCLARTLEVVGPDAFTSNEQLADVWYELKETLTSTQTVTLDLMGKPWTQQDCWNKAMELNPTKYDPPFSWYDYGMQVSGQVPSVANWKVDPALDLVSKDPLLKGFAEGFADNTWGYLCPTTSGHVPRIKLSDFKTVEVLDLTIKDPALTSFMGGFHDGQYGYLAPQSNPSNKFIVPRFRLDTFNQGAVDTLDLAAKGASGAKGFAGGYATTTHGYLIPFASEDQNAHSSVVRFPLSTFDKVEVLNLAQEDKSLVGFRGGFMQGIYGYAIPYGKSATRFGKVTRFSLQGGYRRTNYATYCEAGMDLTEEADCREAAKSLSLTYSNTYFNDKNDFHYCVFADDSRKKVYFNAAGKQALSAPPTAPYAAKYQALCKVAPPTIAALAAQNLPAGTFVEAFSAASVESLDLTDVDKTLQGYVGGFTDLSYGYAVPQSTAPNAGFGKVARWSLQSFMLADVQVLDLAAAATGGTDCVGFSHGFRDGTYGYVLPSTRNAATPHGTVCRFRLDTFDAASVQKLDLSATDISFKGFNGGFAAGNYGYLVPWKIGAAAVGKVARFTLVPEAVVTGAAPKYNGKNAKECFVTQLATKPEHAPSWYRLGMQLGATNVEKATVDSSQFDAFACMAKAACLDNKYYDAWAFLANHLKVDATIKVCDKFYSKIDCAVKAVECDLTKNQPYCKLASLMDKKTPVTVNGQALTLDQVKNKCNPP